jgi:hypothetical protein
MLLDPLTSAIFVLVSWRNGRRRPTRLHSNLAFLGGFLVLGLVHHSPHENGSFIVAELGITLFDIVGSCCH